jgi:glycosyltransferase involved in cell wall biosynthesis
MHIVLDFRPALRQGTGVGTYIRNLVRALSEGFPEESYTVFSASWKDRLDALHVPEGVTVVDRRIPVRLLDRTWHRWGWPRLERFVGPVDVAHSPSPMLMPARRARTVITVHDCYFIRHREDVFGTVRRDYVPLARDAAAAADAVVVNSDSTAAEVEELLGISRDRICVTPLGVEARFFDPVEADARRILDRFGVDRPFLLFVGRRERRKDLGTLLAAFDELCTDPGNLQLLLVGPDAPGWDETWSGASEAVRRHTRILPYQESTQLAGLYAAASALVMPSRWEGFGLPGLEAMACGTPVVAHEVGALPEVLGDAALFAPAGDPSAMAQQCRLLLHDTDRANRARQAGRRRAAEFTWTETARRTHELYRKLSG